MCFTVNLLAKYKDIIVVDNWLRSEIYTSLNNKPSRFHRHRIQTVGQVVQAVHPALQCDPSVRAVCMRLVRYRKFGIDR